MKTKFKNLIGYVISIIAYAIGFIKGFIKGFVKYAFLMKPQK